jgi:hypothetical protein
MEDVASTATSQTLATRGDRSHDRLRRDLERDFQAAFKRNPHRKQLDYIERCAEWILRARAHERSDQFLRSVPQIVTGWGLERTGRGVYADRRRYRAQFQLTFGYLQEMGWITSWEAVYEPNGEGRGILLTVGSKAHRAPQSARRSSSAGQARPRGDSCPPPRKPPDHRGNPGPTEPGDDRAQFGGNATPPLRENALRGRSRPAVAVAYSSKNTTGVGARCSEGAAPARQRTRASDLGGLERGAALIALRTAARRAAPQSGWWGLSALVDAAMAGGDPLAIAIVGFEQCFGGHPHLTRRRREHLLRYCAIRDRLDGRAGSGVLGMLEAMRTTALIGERIVSLDFFVCILRSSVKRQRRRHRCLPEIPFDRGAWWDEREHRLAYAATAEPTASSRQRRAAWERRKERDG